MRSCFPLPLYSLLPLPLPLLLPLPPPTVYRRCCARAQTFSLVPGEGGVPPGESVTVKATFSPDYCRVWPFLGVFRVEARDQVKKTRKRQEHCCGHRTDTSLSEPSSRHEMLCRICRPRLRFGRLVRPSDCLFSLPAKTFVRFGFELYTEVRLLVTMRQKK